MYLGYPYPTLPREDNSPQSGPFVTHKLLPWEDLMKQSKVISEALRWGPGVRVGYRE